MVDKIMTKDLERRLKHGRVFCADIETNGLDDYDVCHCLALQDITGFTNETPKTTVELYSKRETILSSLWSTLNYADVIVGHNFISYDWPAITKLFPELTKHPRFDEVYILDTMIWSRFQHSEKDLQVKDKKLKLPWTKKIHALEAWGLRLGFAKGDYGKSTDWQTYDDEMGVYCQQDVRVNVRILSELWSSLVSLDALDLENRFATIIDKQCRFGWLLDVKAAEKLYTELLTKKDKLQVDLRSIFPVRYITKTKQTAAYDSLVDEEGCFDYSKEYEFFNWETIFEGVDLDYSFVPKSDNSRYGYRKGNPVCKLKAVAFNPNSDAHVLYWLGYKYKFKSWKKTKSKADSVDGEVMSYLATAGYLGTDVPEAAPIHEFQKISKICSMVGSGKQAYLKKVNGTTNRIHGRINTLGTITHRCTHFSPNLGQVPSDNVDYGREVRQLFISQPGWLNIGCDASGIQARGQAHYQIPYDDGAFARKLMSDAGIHDDTAAALGCERGQAKTFRYAWMFGAFPTKLGAILGLDTAGGKRANDRFLKSEPGLAKLNLASQKAVKDKGYLTCLDGRRLSLKTQRTALVTLLQSFEAIVMKRSLVIAYDRLTKAGYKFGRDYAFIGNIHDEIQSAAKQSIAEDVAKIKQSAIVDAGIYYNVRLKLDAEYKIGDSWADTH